MNSIIKLIVIDDHPIVRQGIKEVMDNEDDIEILCEADNASDAIKLLNKHDVDVAIVDITLKGNVSGLDLIKSIKSRFPNIKTLVLSMHNELLYAERSIKAGAMGYIMKADAPDSIADAIRTIMGGELFISDVILKKIVNKVVKGSEESVGINLASLSNRELEIFELLGHGHSSKEIASKLNLSLNTIDVHKKNIREKMKFEDSADLTKNAIQWIILNNKNQI